MVEFFVHKGVLHECLAVVKCAVHLYCGDVLSECRELRFLDATHFPLRVQYKHSHSGHSEEAVCYCAAGVSRSGNQHIHHRFVVALRVEIAEQACHEACTHIFEGECRSVEQLEAIHVACYVLERNIEIQCVIHDVFQHFRFNIFAKQCVGNYK